MKISITNHRNQLIPSTVPQVTRPLLRDPGPRIRRTPHKGEGDLTDGGGSYGNRAIGRKGFVG